MRNYRVTGPVEVPSHVLAAMAAGRMISHRSAEFRQRLTGVLSGLGQLFGTSGLVLPLTCSGTGGLEAAVASVLRRGDRVLSVRQGYFGERFAEIAAFHGAKVDVLAAPWGSAPDAADVGAQAATGYDAILLTHNETSTGVLAPLREWVTAIRSVSDCLVLVDVVSSLGAVPIDFDDLGLDVAVAVTQKALACPPGLTLVAASDRALERAATPGAASYYLDLAAAAEHVRKGTTTYTPALSVVYALEAALADILDEGVDNVWARHADTARRCREALRARGLHPVVDEPLCSPTVTSVRLPGPHAERLRERLAERHDTWVSSGRGAWKQDVVRVGHMGRVPVAAIDSCADALGQVSATLAAGVPGGTSTRLEVRVHRTADDLGDEWDRLVEDVDAPLFHTRAFLRAYEHNPVQRITAPRYLAVHAADGELLAAAPAYLQGDPLGLLGLGEGEQALLSPMWHCPGAQVPARDEDSLRALGRAYREQASLTGRTTWGFINLEAASTAVSRLAEQGFRSQDLVPRWVLPRELAPDPRTLLSSLRRSARRELTRHVRRADEQGVECVVHRADHDGLPALMEFVASTATRAGSPKYYDPARLAAFLRELGEPVRVIEVRTAEQRTLSVAVCFQERTRLQCWAAGYVRDDPELPFSPYYRSWWGMLELFWSSGVALGEFGRLNEAFKSKMGLVPRHQVAMLGEA